MRATSTCRTVGIAAVLAFGQAGAADIEEVVVWGSAAPREAGPVSSFKPAALRAATLVTAEDLVKYEPSLVVRRRFIGDANGTLGMRGANMFQTSRSMVFADGVPLHYLLQSRWDGAPRWSLIAASEVERVDILYGPFSAAYGGNAMGGVILMESRIPQRRELQFESTVFSQDFSAPGFSDSLTGYRSFLSYGDKLGESSVYLSWNHLENRAQPQTWYQGGAPGQGEALAVGGGFSGPNERGQQGLWFGDSGVVDSATDNLKLKLGRDLGGWDLLLNLAWEGRDTASSAPNNYLRHADGSIAWGGNFQRNDQRFSVPAARFGIGNAERESLSAGLRARGTLGDALGVEANLNWFGVLHDQTRTSARNPADPAWRGEGQLGDFGGTGWRSAELKFDYQSAAFDRLRLQAGLRHEDYRLDIDLFASDDFHAGSRTTQLAKSGGTTSLNALFLQSWLDIGRHWELGLGGRLERWTANEGYTGSIDSQDGSFALQQLPARERQAFSPKFALGFLPDANWSLRYSLAHAWRFPIVEELYSQYQAYNALNSANPGLAPERGLHHNLAFEYPLHGGELRLNLYQETVRDVIEAQATVLPGGQLLRTFLPVDEVRTRGAELIANLDDFLLPGLNLRFNLGWNDSRILRNRADPTLEGKVYPRMPRWRANLLLDYRFSSTLDGGIGLRHTSNSFGRLDNLDTEKGVYGAQDEYLFVNLKLNWQATRALRFGLGVENLFDQLAYVAHPWPGRTFFLEAGWRL